MLLTAPEHEVGAEGKTHRGRKGKVKSKKVYINKEVCGGSEKEYERRNTKKLEG